MKILDMALTEFKLITRDRKTFAMLLIMPAVMIFIMGYALKPVFNSNNEMKKFQVLYINNDNGQVGKAFDDLIKNKVSQFVEPVDGNEKDAGSDVYKGKYSNAIIIPNDLSKKLEKGEKISINVISSGKDQIKDFVTRSIVNSFIESVNTRLAIIKGYTEIIPQADVLNLVKELENAGTRFGNQFITLKSSEKPITNKLSSFQFFSASMLLFFMLTTGTGIGNNIIKERHEKIFMRISSFAVRKSEYLLGQIVENIILSILQIVVVMVFTSLAFKVDWGNNLPGVGITLLIMVLISSSLGILFSGFMNTQKSLSSVMTIGIWFMTFAGGGFYPIPSLEPVGKLTFYKWGLDSLTHFMSGGGFGEALPNLAMLTALVILLWTSALILYNRRISHE